MKGLISCTIKSSAEISKNFNLLQVKYIPQLRVIFVMAKYIVYILEQVPR